MILLIDNYDSFSYNLYQLVGEAMLEAGQMHRENPEDGDLQVIRNDALTIAQIADRRPAGIILSPGPGKPSESGVCEEVVQTLGRGRLTRQEAGDTAKAIPILGVCLGHQAICESFGATVSYAKELMHGKQSQTKLDADCPLFAGLPETIGAARYHSLAVKKQTLPPELKVTAAADDKEVMAVMHTKFPIFGLQFHPESIMTPQGSGILKNFLKLTKG